MVKLILNLYFDVEFLLKFLILYQILRLCLYKLSFLVFHYDYINWHIISKRPKLIKMLLNYYFCKYNLISMDCLLELYDCLLHLIKAEVNFLPLQLLKFTLRRAKKLKNHYLTILLLFLSH